MGIYLKEGKKMYLSTCLSTVSKSSHPHPAPLRQCQILYFVVPELGKTLISLAKTTEDVCRKQMDEPQSSPNTSDILQNHHQSINPRLHGYLTVPEDK